MVLINTDRWHIKQQNLSGHRNKVVCLWSAAFPRGQRMDERERAGPSVCGGRTQAVHMEKPSTAVSPAVVSEHRYFGVFPAVTSIVCSFYGSAGSGTCGNSSLSPLLHFSLWVTLELLLTACHCVYSHHLIVWCSFSSRLFRENSAFQTKWANFL